MSACIADITSLALVTLEMVDDFLFVYQGRKGRKSSTISNGSDISSLPKNFRILKKCKSKWDCLMFEMLFIRDLKLTLNKQKIQLPRKCFEYFVHIASFYCFYFFH